MKRAITIVATAILVGMTFAWANETPTSSSKDTYLKKAEAEVQEWTTKLQSLQERSEKSGAKSREELDRHMKVVDDNLAVARRKLDKLKASNEDNWKSFRVGLDETLNDVKRDYRAALSFFNKNETTTKEKS